MDTIKRKLTSRKLWVALAGVVVGLAAIMGAGEAEIATVAGAITATASAVAYIVTEGRLDAASIGHSAEAIQTAIDVIMEDVPDVAFKEAFLALMAPVILFAAIYTGVVTTTEAAIVAALNGPEADSYQAASIREILRGAGVEV